MRQPPEDAPFLAQGFEQAVRSAQGLAVAEEQVAALAQREMQHREHAPLHVRLEVDEQVATGAEVDPRERRVTQQVLRSEHDHVAHVSADPVGVLVLVEIPVEQVGRHVAFDAARIHSGARESQRLLGGVGGEDLDVDVLASALRFFGEQDRERVGLFPARTGRDPGPDRRVRFLFGDQRAQCRHAQGLPGVWIPEKTRDVDHEVVRERDDLLGVVTQVLRILREPLHRHHPHPPLDPTQHGRTSVTREVAFGACMDDLEDLLQLLSLTGQHALGVLATRVAGIEVGLSRVRREHGGHFGGLQGLVGVAGVDQARGHARKLGRVRVLRDAQPTGGLHGLGSRRPVGAHSRQHDGDGFLFLDLR
ncbi:MAG: hypothetical protein K0R70_1974, partial [Steroidobacteraceae bacterium]|nr:hypothetical protein [Steroidobacteraceae bacterium]